MPRAKKQVLRIPPGATIADYPPLAAQLDPATGLATDIRAGSSKNVAWICGMSTDHRWQAPPRRRVANGAGCPFCHGKKPSVTNSLAGLFPEVAAELDVEAVETCGRTAEQILAKSHDLVGWRCRSCGHRWVARVYSRTDHRRVGCPACAGSIVTATGNLAVARPDVAAQWHPSRNGALRPRDVRPGSTTPVWWLCPVHPDHEWRTSPNARTNPARSSGCPACSGYQLSATNNLALYPDIAAQFDPVLNGGRRPEQVLAGTGEAVTWRCDRGPDHIWQVSVVSRTAQNNGCPCCRGFQVSVTNSLATLCPQVAAELDPARNGGLTAAQVTAGSNRRVTWSCAYGHTWRTDISTRVRAVTEGNGHCPQCAPRDASSQQLAVASALAHALPGLAVDPRPETIVTASGRWRPDITVTELHLVVEFDGSYYHRGREAHDTRKSADLRRAGWTVVRLREEPLRPTHPNDLTVPPRPPAAADELVAALLPHLVTVLPEAEQDLMRTTLTRARTTPVPPWRWQPPPGRFRTGLGLLAQYAEREGHASPLPDHREYGFPLGRWVIRQRQLYRTGRLPQAQVDLLTGLHGWTWDRPRPRPSAATDHRTTPRAIPPARRPRPLQPRQQAAPDGFETGRRMLVRFAEREGHACPTSEHREDGFPLGRWLMTQRRLHRAGKLTQAQADSLTDLPGWVWDYQADRWAQFEHALCGYVAREGHARVPQSHVENGYRLGQKVANLRLLHRRGELSRTRTEQLEQLPGWTWVVRGSPRAAG